MLHINKVQFHHNLELTKAYCHAQMVGKEADVARVFRSYNPVVNGAPLYTFKERELNFDRIFYTEPRWEVDPISKKGLVDNLFLEQLQSKERHAETGNSENPLLGRIIISQIDNSVTDGASEACSLGLFDLYDMPAVDTWFYMCNSEEGRLLFAWIPTAFVKYAQDAIDVNCMDCIGWFEEWYESDYWEVMG